MPRCTTESATYLFSMNLLSYSGTGSENACHLKPDVSCRHSKLVWSAASCTRKCWTTWRTHVSFHEDIFECLCMFGLWKSQYRRTPRPWFNKSLRTPAFAKMVGWSEPAGGKAVRSLLLRMHHCLRLFLRRAHSPADGGAVCQSSAEHLHVCRRGVSCRDSIGGRSKDT